MKKQIVLLALTVSILLISCGPSEEDKIAAKRGCSLIKNYEKWQQADSSSKQFSQELFMSSMENYLNALKDADANAAKTLMQESCGDKMEVFDEIMKK